jgi:lipopolysaccharide transport system ATP-binding protein
MSDIAIRVENLSKRYRIGQGNHARYETLRESLASAALAPLRWLRSGSAHRAQRSFIWALKDVSLQVEHGEALGIIGRNGAGKSTLLKILSRITDPTTGAVDLYGRVGSLLEVGTGFHPELTGRENIYLNGAILGMKKSELMRKFDEIVSFAEIEQFVDTPVKFYSSGMYMRLAFSVAAHLEPEILLIDEVLAVGDALFQKKALGKMGEVTKGGRTVLFVSHNLNAVEELCGRCILLENGHIAADSKNVRSVLHQYLSEGLTQSETSIWKSSELGEQTVTAYQNPYITPISFAVVDRDGHPLRMPVSNTTEMWVEMEFQLNALDPALNIGYALYDDENRLLYWSNHNDQAETSWPALNLGLNILLGQIPGRVLNEGKYRLEMIAGLYFRQWLLQPGFDVPSITLEIQGGLSDSPFWMAKRPGILAPVLQWRSSQKRQDDTSIWIASDDRNG